MNNIGSFFDKFKNLAFKELRKREVICEAVYKVTGQNIDIKDISIKDSTVTIKGNHGLKSEIFLKKKAVLNLIPKNYGVFDVN